MNPIPDSAPPGEPPQAARQSNALALEFRGNAREYFRIWAVNLCLTLLTAGIFSAWAKVRKKRYFYSHTLLDGTPFQYLGQPLPILKGRIIAAVLFLIYYASTHFFTSTLPYVIVAAVALAPWVIVRSAAFNARYTAFRNMTFTFNAGYWGAVKTIYVWGLIPALIVGSVFDWGGNYLYAGLLFGLFGLAFPFWIKRLKEFIVGNTVFGGRQAEFSATGGQFFRIYFAAGGIVIISGAATGVLAAALFPSMKGAEYAFIVAAFPIYFGLLKQHGISPNAFASLMERLAKGQEKTERTLGFVSTHPVTAERVQRARAAAEQ